MAFFVLNSEITIGDFTFKGVNNVRIRKSLLNYNDSAVIKLPGKAKIIKGKRAIPVTLSTGILFNDGDKVTIKLGYNGDMRTEFEGFVKRRNIDKTIEIECEGYVRQLRQNVTLTKHYASTTAKQLLKDVCANTEIEVVCPVDFPLSGIDAYNANGCKVIDHIIQASDRTLTVFFIEPKKLWCGLVYTAYLAGTETFKLPTVSYRLGYNCSKENNLRERVPDEPVQVIINGQLVTGESLTTESSNKKAAKKVKRLLNNVPSTATLKKFAQEKEHQMNYTGYEGSLKGFLQPFCLPGYTAIIKDSAYPERDGKYLIEAVTISFGLRGARREVEIGPRVGSV